MGRAKGDFPRGRTVIFSKKNRKYFLFISNTHDSALLVNPVEQIPKNLLSTVYHSRVGNLSLPTGGPRPFLAF